MIIFLLAILSLFSCQLYGMEGNDKTDLNEFLSEFNLTKVFQELNYNSIREQHHMIKSNQRTEIDHGDLIDIGVFKLIRKPKNNVLISKNQLQIDPVNIRWCETKHSFNCLCCDELFYVHVSEVSLERAFNEALNHSCNGC